MSAVNDERLAGLMEEIERAWMENRDDSVADRLAKQYPELAESLYLFFATVIDAQDELGRHRPELADSARRTREWLEKEGFARAERASEVVWKATEATPTPIRRVAEAVTPTFVGLLRQVTGADPQTLAAELDITLDFLVEVSSNARVLPTRVKRELASRVHRVRGIGFDRALASLVAPVQLQRAASRGAAYSDARVTYDELVSHSQLSPEQKEYWHNLGSNEQVDQNERDMT
ncbi:MAG: hypothetical protein JWM95_2587 [Gemmatimonadetes bacterium]|nr:hypothetical protein [Gemmatimonadota bacterium]